MTNSARLQELERQIGEFPYEEQLWLIERLVHSLRAGVYGSDTRAAELAAMAVDPDIQRELREIEKDFSQTEQDGLE